MDTLKLDELIKIKKKENTSKTNKDSFKEQMLTLFRNKGYVNMTEQYFYKGFSFCGALPFVEYMKECDNKISLYYTTKLGQLYNSPTHNVITFKFYVNLLAYLLVELPNEGEMINDLIANIPVLSLNKNGKRSKEISIVFKKYFLDILTKKRVNLSLLDTNNLDKNSIQEFSKLVNETFSGYETKNPQEIIILNKLSNWVKEDRQGDNISQRNLNNNLHDNFDIDKEIKKKLVRKVGQDWRYNLETIKETIESLEKGKLLLLEVNNQLKLELKVKEDELNKKNIKVDEMQKEITELKTINEGLFLEKRNLERANKQYLEKITRSKQEIEERKEMYSIVQKDNDRKSDEVMNRLASELKYDYIDYLDAKNQEMSVDLGENMRCQLESLFRILGKYGVINK